MKDNMKGDRKNVLWCVTRQHEEASSFSKKKGWQFSEDGAGPPLVQTAGWGCAPERCQLGKPHSPGVRASYSKAESDKDRKQRPGRAQPVRFVCHPSPNGCFYLLNTFNTHWTSVLPELLHEFIFISTVTLFLMLNKLWFISSKPVLTVWLQLPAVPRTG